jgi:anti-sigma B factor antagonist
VAPSQQVIIRDEDDSTRVIIVRGDVDIADADRLRDALADSRERGLRRLLIDLSGLAFIDSACIGALISGYQLARTAGIDVQVVRPSPFAYRLLQAMGMLQLFGLVEE